MEFIREGSANTTIDEKRAEELLDDFLVQLEQRGPLRRVLLLPPDITRLHSWAGFLTCLLYRKLAPRTETLILPAIGTHAPMSAEEIDDMFPGIPHDAFRNHDWRNGVVSLGDIPIEVMRRLSNNRLDFSARVEVDRLLADEKWDAIVSIGQLVPHEVIGIANHNKNVFIGVGGTDLINKSHWLGAVHGIERIMGRTRTPVREVLNYASENLAKHLPIVYLLTVRARNSDGALVTRGLFAGDDGVCFEHGAALARRVNLDLLDRAPKKVIVYLDPQEFKSTWLGNKAVYRTRMAIADDGELIVLAPGVRQFGEDPTIDELIRRFGYRGTPATLESVRTVPELGRNLSAAAHLIHGSSEGRFTITYCPGHLSREAIENVGYRYGDLPTMLKRYPPDELRDGWNQIGNEEVYYISNPALGLWGTADRFEHENAP